MKTHVAIVAAALTFAVTVDPAMGLAKYLNELPNGTSFQQALGHPGDDSSKTTAFAQAFAAAGHTWSSSLCKAKFPSSSMTNGAAFGDPCCTWKKGGKPDFTVTAFTTTPGKATTCASKGGASSSTSSAAGSTASSSPASSNASSSAGSSTAGASDATKGASDATKGAVSSAPSSSDASSSAAGSTGGSSATPASSTSGAGDATKGSPWGSSTIPTSGGGCAAKSATKSLRR